MHHQLFTIPADFNVSTLERFCAQNNARKIKIKEVYGSLKNSDYGSGRRGFDFSNISNSSFEEYVRRCIELDVDFNYTLNASCMGNIEFDKQARNQFLCHVESLYESGIRCFTVAIPSVAQLLSEHFSEIKMTLSIIAGIENLDQIRMCVKIPYIKNVYIHEKINRNLPLIKAITDIANENDVAVGTIVNLLCMANCPFRQFHYNYTGHMTQPEKYITQEYYAYICLKEKMQDARYLINASWFRPEDIERYLDAGVRRFKIAGRERIAQNAQYEKVVDMYNQRKYEGNIISLLTSFAASSLEKAVYIPNGPALDLFLTDIFTRQNICNQFGCTNCFKCHDVLKSIRIDPEYAKACIADCNYGLSMFQK